jgi:cytochrome c oxidase assembly factor CtaG
MNFWADANGWPFPPYMLLGCLLVEALYLRGWRIIIKGIRAKEGGSSFSSPDSRRIWFWRGTSLVGATFVFLFATSALVDTLSGWFLWIHMIQHLLFLTVIPPMLLASAPLLPLWLGLPRWSRRLIKACIHLKVRRVCYRVGGWLRQPVVSCILLVVGTWFWHWPPLYDLALTNDVIHDWCEHATFLAVSLLFWSQLVPSAPLHMRLGYLGRIGCLGIAIAQNVVLAVLLGFAPLPLYAPYAHLQLGPGTFSALQDQQLGAGIMWTFGDLPFGIALSMLVNRWLVSQSDDVNVVAPSRPT